MTEIKGKVGGSIERASTSKMKYYHNKQAGSMAKQDKEITHVCIVALFL
jgi:hypothetical protein